MASEKLYRNTLITIAASRVQLYRISFVLQRSVSEIIALSNQAPEILALPWILSLIIEKPYCFSIPEITSVVTTRVQGNYGDRISLFFRVTLDCKVLLECVDAMEMT